MSRSAKSVLKVVTLENVESRDDHGNVTKNGRITVKTKAFKWGINYYVRIKKILPNFA
jgi:hypothetical protein